MSDTTPAAAENADVNDDVNVDVVAATDGVYALVVADFDDTDAAWAAYEELKAVEDGRTVEIEAVIVVKREDDGTIVVQKTSDHSTRRGLGWGVLGGVVLGVIFPPSIIASAVVLGAGGAAIGKAREVHHKKELADELADVLDNGHSGLIALVSDPQAVALQKALEKANRVVEKAIDKVAAEDMKAAAKEVEAEEKAEGKAEKAEDKA